MHVPFDAAEATRVRYSLNEPTTDNPGRGVDSPPPYSAEIKERVELTSTPPLGLCGLFLRWTLPLPLPLTTNSEELPGFYSGFSEELSRLESGAVFMGKLILDV
jgi:hypothetical protein